MCVHKTTASRTIRTSSVISDTCCERDGHGGRVEGSAEHLSPGESEVLPNW